MGEIIPLKDIPGAGEDDSDGKSSERIGEWLKDIWKEKEEILTTVYEGTDENTSENNNNYGEQNGHVNSVKSDEIAAVQNGHASAKESSIELKSKQNSKKPQYLCEIQALDSLKDKFVEHKLESQLKPVHYFLFVWWSVFSFISIYVVCHSFVFQIIALIVTSVTVYVNVKYGGWDYLEMKFHKQQKLLQQKSS